MSIDLRSSAETPPPRQHKISLADRFVQRSGTILISGVQALVRLMLLQADRDAAAGIRTGGFVSGYRGSPLGTLDTAFAGAHGETGSRNIIVRPAVNEELAATAVAGSQQIVQTPYPKVDGVFALWYGKGPGLDRASDAIRHGNYQGSSPHGGVVLAVGDDHVAKSSSIICYSDEVVAGLQVPLFYPADGREIVEYGLHGFAMSRHTGSYAALKIITEVADATRTQKTDELALSPVLPKIDVPPAGMYNRWPEMPLEQEARLIAHRLPAVAAYVRANGLDRIVLKEHGARIGIIAAGKSWLDLQEALRLLGLSGDRLSAAGVALYKPALIWPLEPTSLAEFSTGLDSIIVVEEKASFIERQAKEILYDKASAPMIWGKRGQDGGTLFQATGDLTPERIAAALAPLLGEIVAGAASKVRAALDEQGSFSALPMLRKPFFCSGCPHNRSTVLPDGSRALSGIGCHGLAAYNRPSHGSFAQMGGEGIHWMGLAPFTDETHIFANMGDGTYFHSGLLAIRQAVAAHLNITYKLLYNSAVAMTGGQSVDGELSIARIVEQIRAEGVNTIIVSTDDLGRYPSGHPVRIKADSVEHRDDLDALQLRLRATPGVSVIVYEQMCATEKRRLRKRGKLADPTARAFINEAVCEGCGDCSVKSNCLSVEPVETAFGTKRRINQSSCNKDYSCVRGFCPSFVTIEGGQPARKSIASFDSSSLPPPSVSGATHERIVVAGIGGTGVVTIGALAAMAAHSGRRAVGVLDQVGMAQKGGAVVSHIHLANAVEPISALRIPAGEASLILACDQIVGNLPGVLATISPGRTHVIANADTSITGDFVSNREAVPDSTLLARRLLQRAGLAYFIAHPFSRLAERLFGDVIASNLMMLGLAWQKGWIVFELAEIESAIDLNGTASAMNKAAFGWGRRLAIEPAAVYAAADLAEPAAETLDALIDRHAQFLLDYQDAPYAERFRLIVGRIRHAETEAGGHGELTATASEVLAKLMAYKDEYEVARLYTNGTFAEAVRKAFVGDVKLTLHMAPPILARRDPVTGHLRKRAFGGWILPLLRLLAHGKRLRGGPLDPFGRTLERRAERQLIVDYEILLERLLKGLTASNLIAANSIAGLALQVRGYGHVKERAISKYTIKLREALLAYDSITGGNAFTKAAANESRATAG